MKFRSLSLSLSLSLYLSLYISLFLSLYWDSLPKGKVSGDKVSSRVNFAKKNNEQLSLESSILYFCNIVVALRVNTFSQTIFSSAMQTRDAPRIEIRSCCFNNRADSSMMQAPFPKKSETRIIAINNRQGVVLTDWIARQQYNAATQTS